MEVVALWKDSLSPAGIQDKASRGEAAWELLQGIQPAKNVRS
jgi:hypothetical protein